MTRNRPRKSHRNRCLPNIRGRRWKLQLCTTLILMVVSSFYLYIQWSPIYYMNTEIEGLEKQISRSIALEVGGYDSMNRNKQFAPNKTKLKDLIVRKILTKSLYPTTLTDPYKIENPDLCTGVAIALLFVVHTATAHFDRRTIIRQTFGNKDIFKTINTRVVFLLGRTNDTRVEKRIQNENSEFGDIVQGDFMDTYRNLTLKAVMGLRWITEHCSHAKLIVKVDDDIFIDVFKVVEMYVPMYARKKKQIVCHTWPQSTIYRGKSKWRIDEDYFRGVKYYPPYCSGFTVFMTPDVVKILYHVAFFTPFFWVDDVYVYGILPSKQKITHIHWNNFSLKWQKCINSYKSPNSNKYVSCAVRRPRDMQIMWKHSLLKLSEKTRRKVNNDILAIFGISVKNETKKG